MNVMQRHHTKGLANDWDGKIWLS